MWTRAVSGRHRLRSAIDTLSLQRCRQSNSYCNTYFAPSKLLESRPGSDRCRTARLCKLSYNDPLSPRPVGFQIGPRRQGFASLRPLDPRREIRRAAPVQTPRSLRPSPGRARAGHDGPAVRDHEAAGERCHPAVQLVNRVGDDYTTRPRRRDGGGRRRADALPGAAARREARQGVRRGTQLPSPDAQCGTLRGLAHGVYREPALRASARVMVARASLAQHAGRVSRALGYGSLPSASFRLSASCVWIVTNQ